MKANDDLTSEQLGKLISKECGLNISSSTTRRVRREKLGWKHENTRNCQFVREPNKVKRLAFCLDALARKDTFEDVIFKNETTVQIEQYARVSFGKDGTQAKRKGRPKHPLKVCKHILLEITCANRIPSLVPLSSQAGVSVRSDSTEKRFTERKQTPR
ncbi:Hypothetical predicted protein [Paramuricea clavata]|uniref:Uncharacterized protein n=1 Tax=Paramuricea clavata TaxID=317549 RepID=A0A6S7K425_PARCT|nr:Hypothetical predicted protein [Paramuricea clavata]